MTNTDGAQALPTSKTIQIGDKERKLSFDIPFKFAPGHVCNENESNVLNQIMRENIGNNWRKKVQATLDGEKDALSEDDLRSQITAYAAGYEFSAVGAGGGREALSPLEREARKIAKQVVVAMISQPSEAFPQGRKIKDIDEEKFAAEVARIAATDKVQALAAKNLKAQEKSLNDLLASVGDGLTGGETAVAA